MWRSRNLLTSWKKGLWLFPVWQLYRPWKIPLPCRILWFLGASLTHRHKYLKWTFSKLDRSLDWFEGLNDWISEFGVILDDILNSIIIFESLQTKVKDFLMTCIAVIGQGHIITKTYTTKITMMMDDWMGDKRDMNWRSKNLPFYS